MTGARTGRLLGVVGLLLATAPVWGSMLPDPQVTEHDADAVRTELDRLEAVGDGILLTLAVCEEDEYCVTAMSEHELARLIDRIQPRIRHLREQEAEQGLGSEDARFLERYRALRDRYADYLGEVRSVAERIDADALEGAWEDFLEFGIAEADLDVDTGPDVPSPNEELTLDRFQDTHKPMPID